MTLCAVFFFLSLVYAVLVHNAFVKVHMVKERWFWSRVNFLWTFQLADVEGEDETKRVINLGFDTWTGAVRLGLSLSHIDTIWYSC